MLVCQECGKEVVNALALTTHVRCHKLTPLQYYDKHVKKDGEGLCLKCGKPTPYKWFSVGYQKHCKFDCGRKTEEEIRATEKAWRESHKEETEAYNKEYQSENKVEIKNKRLLKQDELRLKGRLYVHNRIIIEEGRDWLIDYKKGYYGKNCVHLREEARFRSLLTKELIQIVYEFNIKKYGTLTCYLCLKPIAFGDDNLEHKVPMCKRKYFPTLDIHSLKNMDVAHKACNIIKGRRLLCECSLEEFTNRRTLKELLSKHKEVHSG